MPRQSRITISDTVYHVYTRGHHKSPLFIDDEDRFVFLKHLKRAQERCPWDCLGYSLMTNHYHLQVKTHDLPIGKTMHYLNTLYAGHFNFRYKTVGHVFQNRFHSIPVQVDRYLLVLSRYIHLNAVVAGMVTKPEDHVWSSYREYIGQTFTGLIRPKLILDTLCDNPALQAESYKNFVEDIIFKKPEFTEELLWKTRIFGDDLFTKTITASCPASFAPRQDYRRQKETI
jgi:putative transposase